MGGNHQNGKVVEYGQFVDYISFGCIDTGIHGDECTTIRHEDSESRGSSQKIQQSIKIGQSDAGNLFTAGYFAS